ncbi:hypothetical protein I5535_13155 [Rhodobacteraceae bacterium F11138]|nr:hypothetical protein [Rhodobacteraceae bacterium F11138]
MHRLRHYMAALTGACVAGAALIAALSLGYYSWGAVAVSAAIGLIAAWPAGIWFARQIKREDPDWDHRRDQPRT